MKHHILFIVVLLAVVGLFEGGVLPEGALADVQPTEYFATIALQALTLVAIPVAIGMMHIDAVGRLLKSRPQLLPRLLTARIHGLWTLLIVLIAAYYVFMKPSFFYLAAFALLAIAAVTLAREQIDATKQ